MKKSFFVGFLATLGLGAGYPGTTSSSTTTTTVTTTGFPTAVFGPSGSTSSQVVASSTAEALANAAFATGDNSAVSIDSLFLRLPSPGELDQLILSADSVAILKTVQTVATDDSLTCDQRIAYLLQIIGRIRAAVEKKQFSADQLKVIIDGANAQIARLQNEIARINGEINDLWLDQLSDNLAKAVSDLEALYAQFNAVEANIAPNEAKIAGYEKQIATLTGSTDAERNRINNDRLRLTQVESLIRDIEAQLADARNREAALNASIAKSQDIINRNTATITTIRSKITALETETRQLRDELDRIRAKNTDLEIKVERLRTDLNVANGKADRYRAQIRDLQVKLAAERKKLPSDDLDDLNQMIAALKKFIPTIQTEIDRHYYYCYGQGSVTVEQTGNTVVYIVRGENFGDYLRNQYGAGTVTPSLRQLGSIELRRVDIFGPVWTAQFGFPFTGGSLDGTGLSIAGSFNCLNPNAVTNGVGTISGISADRITVSTGQGSASLRLGSCSRIESTSQLPTIGQTIAFKAVGSLAQGYNLYSATCY